MSTDDVEAHAICQPGWELNYEQLSRGQFRGIIDHMHLPGLSALREGANRAVRQFGQMSSYGYGFAVPLAIEGEWLFSGQRLSMHSIMVGPSNDLELCSQGPFLMTGIIVDAELLQQCYWQIFRRSPAAWLDRQVVLELAPGAVERIRNRIRNALDVSAALPAILDDPAAYGQLRDALLLECLNALPAEVDCSELKAIEARRKVVDRASEFIHAYRSEPVSLLQLCSYIGASERKLNYCFQDVLGMSPGRYLRAARLNGVRRELRCGDARLGVQDIAAHWGFWHLGQFSTDYKRQFGELPSETLRRARTAQSR